MSTAFASPEIRQVMRHRFGQLGGIALALLALLVLLALFSYNPHDPSLNTATSRRPSNWAGLGGAMMADVLIQSFGLASILLPLAMFAWAWRLLNRPNLQFTVRLLTTLLALTRRRRRARRLSRSGELVRLRRLGRPGRRHRRGAQHHPAVYGHRPAWPARRPRGAARAPPSSPSSSCCSGSV